MTHSFFAEPAMPIFLRCAVIDKGIKGLFGL